MTDLIERQAAIDDMKDMYQAAEKWGREAADDVIKARAESCMATLVEMKLRIEKLPTEQPEYEEVTPRNISDHFKRAGVYEPIDWFSRLQFLNEMGYVICKRKKM